MTVTAPQGSAGTKQYRTHYRRGTFGIPQILAAASAHQSP